MKTFPTSSKFKDWAFYLESMNTSTSTWGHRGHDRMVNGFITTYAISAYYH